MIKYKSCPYCYSKKIEEKEIKGFIIVSCLDCKNKIDTLEKEGK
jgi:hypothetical protein